MKSLIALLAPQCADRSTLDELAVTASDRARWARSHGLFDRIRSKTLIAERNGDTAASAQYAFEEVCAKTLYNLSGASAPFDADSPYWIIPSAVVLARQLGLPESEVLRIVAV